MGSVSDRFEELDWRPTRSARSACASARTEPGVDVYEVKLGDGFLMSSLFTAAEVALADLALASLPARNSTSWSEARPRLHGRAVLRTAGAFPRRRRGSGEVIGWHERGLLPLSHRLTSDRGAPRERRLFAIVAGGERFGPGAPERHDAILVDIDHTPDISCTRSRRLLRPRGQRARGSPRAGRRLRAVVRRPSRRGLPLRRRAGLRVVRGARRRLPNPLTAARPPTPCTWPRWARGDRRA